MKPNYRYSLMVILCLITFFVPKNQSYADEFDTTIHLRFTNDAPLTVVPDIPIDQTGGNQSDDKPVSEENDEKVEMKAVLQSLLPQTGESINRLISLLGVALFALVIYLNKNKQKKEGR